MRLKKVQIPIYYGNLIIVVSDDYNAVAKKFNLKQEVNLYGAFSWANRDKKDILNYYVCVDEKVSNHLIAHEVVHLVNFIFLEKRIELDRINDEPQAYLTGWIFKQINSFLD
jgi:hypothetical protein